MVKKKKTENKKKSHKNEKNGLENDENASRKITKEWIKRGKKITNYRPNR